MSATSLQPSDGTTTVTCPLCHSPRTAAGNDGPHGTGWWRCERCLQPWSRARLDTVAEYQLSEDTRLRAHAAEAAVLGPRLVRAPAL